MANAINKNMKMLDPLQASICRYETKGRTIKSRHGAAPIMQTCITEDGQSHEEIFKQGETIKTDLNIQGNKIFTDAAWRTKKVPGSHGRTTTGIGAYCLFQQNDLNATVLIQASSPMAPSALHAEAMALLLATQLAQQLHAHKVTFLTDNLTLARAAAASRSTVSEVPWEIQEHIAQYQKASRDLQSTIYHVKRDLNGVAHDCARQAIRQSQSRPIFSCSNSAHGHGNCPIVLATQNIILLHAVHCL
uniref:Uncharacterized protein n=1 Tax=Avena sativa TaxID=4498 RepID=A0ACD5YZR5_AVESA